MPAGIRGQLPGRVLAALRYGGLRYLARRAVGKLLWAEWIALAIDLDGRSRLPATSLPLAFRALDSHELEQFLLLRPGLTREEVLGRLAAGHRCLAVWLEGNVVAAVWVRFDRSWLPILERSMPLAAGEAYAYDSFTHPDYRQVGAVTFLGRSASNYLAGLGYRRRICYVLAENQPGLAAAKAIGYEVTGRLGWLHVGRVGVEIIHKRSGETTRALHIRRKGEPEITAGHNA
jgi:hypothetical protein